MTVFPTLYTERLTLRKIQVEDVDALVKYANNKKISGQIINIPYPYEEPNAVFRISYVVQGFKNKTRYVFAIILNDAEELIGEISLHLGNDASKAELGYWVAEPYWNKGIATEAIKAIVKFGFEKLNLHLIFATCHEDNASSCKTLLKNGFTQGRTSGHVISFTIVKEEKQYTIRKLLAADIEQYKTMRLEALQTEPGVFGNSYATEAAYSDEQWLERLNSERCGCFGLYHGSEFMGITAISCHDKEKPHEAYMSQSYIRLAHRGKGLSKLLYEARLEWARVHNIKRLVIGHRETNLVSKNANQHFGFKYTHSESRTWPDGVVADMLYYELLL